MTRFVLDASVVLSWIVDEPVAPYATHIRAQILGGDLAVVPRWWELEFANGLLVAERRGIISGAEADDSIVGMERWKRNRIEIEDGQPSMRDILLVARTFQLAAYDAAYLELARREGLPLATLDRRLGEAAEKAGVKRA